MTEGKASKREISNMTIPVEEEAPATPLFPWSCLNCRHVKVRCDRTFPECGRCTLLKQQCTSQVRGPGRPLKRSRKGTKYTKLQKVARHLQQLQQKVASVPSSPSLSISSGASPSSTCSLASRPQQQGQQGQSPYFHPTRPPPSFDTSFYSSSMLSWETSTSIDGPTSCERSDAAAEGLDEDDAMMHSFFVEMMNECKLEEAAAVSVADGDREGGKVMSGGGSGYPAVEMRTSNQFYPPAHQLSGTLTAPSLASFLAHDKEQQQQKQPQHHHRQQQQRMTIENDMPPAIACSVTSSFLAGDMQQQQQPQQTKPDGLLSSIIYTVTSFLAPEDSMQQQQQQQVVAIEEPASSSSVSSSQSLSGMTTTASSLSYDRPQQQGQQGQSPFPHPTRPPPTFDTSFCSCSVLSWETSTSIDGPTSCERSDAAAEGLDEDDAMMQSFFVEMLDGCKLEEAAAVVSVADGDREGGKVMSGGGSGYPAVEMRTSNQFHPHVHQLVDILSQTAVHLYKQGQVQRLKTLAIIRKWEAYSHLLGKDASCGVANTLLHCLAAPLPPLVIPVVQGAVKENLFLRRKTTTDLLSDYSLVPKHISNILMASTANCGFIFARGQFRMWTNLSFAAQYFDSMVANQKLQETGLLPIYIYASIMRPEDRLCFFRQLSVYLLTAVDEKQEVAMIVETIKHDGSMQPCVIRFRHVVLNDAEYSCMAMSILALPTTFSTNRLAGHRAKEEPDDDDGLPLKPPSFSSYGSSSSSSSSRSSSYSSSSTSEPNLPSQAPSAASINQFNHQSAFQHLPPLLPYTNSAAPTSTLTATALPSTPYFHFA